MEQKLREEDTPIEKIYDHKKVFLMACSSAPKSIDEEYSDNFEPEEPSAQSTKRQDKEKRIWSTKPPKIPNKLSKYSMTL